MIQELTQQGLSRFIQAAVADDFIGARVLSGLRCYGTDSGVCRFYLVDDSAALMVLGSGALLCGVAQNVEELEAFLRASGVCLFKANLTMLYTWRIVPRLVMKHVGTDAAADLPAHGAQGKAQEATLRKAATDSPPLLQAVHATRCERAAVMDTQPNLWQLAHSGLPCAAQPEDWYADACLRVNKGEAEICAVRLGETYVATAGVYCRDERSAYITAVATAAAHRGRGYATALLRHLCTAHAGHSIYLLCSPALRVFYEKRGFALARPLCEFTSLEQEK